jgi:hypothetical protein
MNFVLDKQRISASKAAQLLLSALIALVVAVPVSLFAQPNPGSQVSVYVESSAFRSATSGRWIDQQTWQVYRSGVWIPAGDVQAGIPDASRSVFIETNHTIIATRAQVNTPGAGRDYNGNQAQAYVEVADLHINTAASITTTWGSIIGGFASAGQSGGVGGPAGGPAVVGTYNGDFYDGDRFGGYVNPDPVAAGVSVLSPGAFSFSTPGGSTWQTGYFGGSFDRVVVETIDQSGRTTGAVNGQLLAPYAGHPDPGTQRLGAASIDPVTGFTTLVRPRNNELRVYGKLRYYAGSAENLTDRDANIQVTAATIGTGSTIVFRGSSRTITTPSEWSTTLATTTGYGGGNLDAIGIAAGAAGDNSVFVQNATRVANAEIRNRFKGLMGRNSFWTAIFDLGRVRDRSTGRDVYVNMNDNPSAAQGVLRGNFTAGIIQVRRGTLRFEGQALLANEGAATSGSIQICNNAVLSVNNAQIGRTAVPVQPGTLQLGIPTSAGSPFGSGASFASPNVSAHPAVAAQNPFGYAPWGYAANSVNGTVSFGAPTATLTNFAGNYVAATLSANHTVGLPMTPSGPFVVTSRMRYFVVEEGGALDFTGPTGIEVSTNVGTLFPPVNPTNNNFTLGSTLSAADVRFNGTVIYSRPGDQYLVPDSPFLSYNPTGLFVSLNGLTVATPQVAGGSMNIGENGIFDPYNNLRDPYSQATYAQTLIAGGVSVGITTGGQPGFVGTASYGVGAAGLFAPSTTAAYSHLTLRGSGFKYLIATTVTISRSLLLQGRARIWNNPIINVSASQPTGTASIGGGTVVNPIYGISVPTVAGPGALRFAGYPQLVYLRSTGLRGYFEENNVGTTIRPNLNVGAGGLSLGFDDGTVQTVPMWSAYGGNTDPVAFVGFTTATTSIVAQDNDLAYPIGMVLSASTNREQMDMSPWHKPAVVHGLPAEPSYVGAGQGIGTHGWSFRGQQYGVQELSGARFGQVIRQSLDRVNGDFVGASGASDPLSVMNLPLPLASMNTATTSNDNLIAFRHRNNGGIGVGAAASSGTTAAGNFPMITNSLYDYSINTTATATLQYDSDLGDVMSQIEFPQGALGPHNLVINGNAGLTYILPERTNTGLKYGTNAFTAIVFGVTSGTVIAGPEYTNSTNGNLPRQAFNPTYSGNVPYYQANAVYNNCQPATNDASILDNNGSAIGVTPGVLASAYIDTRPDVQDQQFLFSGPITGAYGGNGIYGTSGGFGAVSAYVQPQGLRPETGLRDTDDGRVRTGFPRIFTQVGAMLPYLPATNLGPVGGIGLLAHGNLNPGGVTANPLAFGYAQGGPRRIPTNAPSDFGRRGDYNNFGVLELRRGVLEIPAKVYTVETLVFNQANVLTGSGFPDGRTPAGSVESRAFTYTLTLSSTAIISRDQQNVTYRGNLVGTGNPNRVWAVLSDNPNRGSRGVVGSIYASAAVGGTQNAGGATLRGPAGPANLSGDLKGGSQVNIIFTGGTGGTVNASAVYLARGANGRTGGVGAPLGPSAANSNDRYGYEPPTYTARDGSNSGVTELSVVSGVPGVVAVPILAPDVFATGSNLAPVFNPGPEKYSDVDFTNPWNGNTAGPTGSHGRDETVRGDGRVLSATNDFTGVVAHSGVNIFTRTAAGGMAWGEVVRANNAYNIDLPRITGGVRNLTFMRATSNVLTLLGNAANVNGANGPDAVTSNNAERLAGLVVYGTIATVRGDIDLNGRNIELDGNRALLVETQVKTQVVDSLLGRMIWTSEQQGLPRDLSGGTLANHTGPTNTVTYSLGNFGGVAGLPGTVIGSAFPVLPNTVINNHRGARAYIGLSSARNIATDNSPGGVTETREDVGGLGAMIFAAGNPVQVRVRRWQTRGDGILGGGAVTNQGNVRPRGAGTGIDRYWQIETTGTLSQTMTRSEVRFQYVDTDLANDNGCLVGGISPVALNIFRTAGQPAIGATCFGTGRGGFPNDGFDPNVYQLQNWQALYGKTFIGQDMYNIHKQLTVNGPAQVVAGQTVLGVANFTQIGCNDVLAGGQTGQNDPMNTNNPNSGFQMWSIGVTAPRCFVVRGQRYGGSFGQNIGGGPADISYLGGQISPASPLTITAAYTSTVAAGGGVAAGTASLYGAYVGPFKAGIQTNATVIVEILDDFNNVAFTATGFAGRLRLNNPPENGGFAANFITNGASGTNQFLSPTSGVQVSGANGVQGGRLEFPNLTIGGVASTNLTISVIPTDATGNEIRPTSTTNPQPNQPAGFLPMCSQPVQVSLQGGLPFRLEFDSATSAQGGTRYKVPGRVNGADGNSLLGNPSFVSGYNPLCNSPASGGAIIVGNAVNFGTDFTNNNNITVVVRDRFGNLASLPTTVQISLGGGTPVVDPIRTALGGQFSSSQTGATGFSWGLGKTTPGFNVPVGTTPYGTGFEVQANTAPQNAAFGPSNGGQPAGFGIPAVFSDLTAAGVNTNPQNTSAGGRAPATNPLFNDASLLFARPEIHHPQVNTHFVTFPNFTVYGATSNNVTLIASLPSDILGDNVAQNFIAGGNTSATVTLCSGPAVRVAPFVQNYDGVPARIPGSMFIGRVARSFCVQAVDIFGNRVLDYTSIGTGDRTATITFPTNTNGPNFPYDPIVDNLFKPNDSMRMYQADGTTAPAVNGLYCFNNFIPRSPVSTVPPGMDILLNFQDPNFGAGPNASVNQNPGFFPTIIGFKPQPVTTTASTTFYPVPTVSISVTATGPSESAARVGTTGLALRERAITFNGDTGNGAFPSGTVNVGIGTGAVVLGNPGVISYSLAYTDRRGGVLGLTAPNSVGLPRPLPSGFRAGTATGALPAPTDHAIVNNVAGGVRVDSTMGGLRDDLMPMTRDNNNVDQPVTLQATIPANPTATNPATGGTGSISLNSTRPSQPFTFRARYSDQEWDDPATTVNERTPGLQGVRTVTMTLYADTVGTAYQLDPAARTATVTLDDPPRRRPNLENAIQNREVQLTREEVSELESPQPRPDNGRPSWVFYDDNYDPLTYSVAFDASLVNVTLNQRDPRFNGRPSLVYRAAANAQRGANTDITVFAFDSQGTFALNTFNIRYVDPRTGTTAVANGSAEALRVAPSETTDKVTVSGVAKATGRIVIKVQNLLGQAQSDVALDVVAGQAYNHEINLANQATGQYFIVVNDGGEATTAKVVKK